MNENTLKWAQEQLKQLRTPALAGRAHKETILKDGNGNARGRNFCGQKEVKEESK